MSQQAGEVRVLTGTAKLQCANAGWPFAQRSFLGNHYMNGWSLGNPALVDAAHGLKMQTPFSGADPAGPSSDARFGRSAAAVVWPSDSGGTTTLKTFLLVGETDVTLTDGSGDHASAGRVFAFKTPLNASYSSPTYSGAGNEPNAWSSQLTDPTGIQSDAIFGSWIATGNYLGSSTILGQQIIISARGKDVSADAGAGQAYSFDGGT
ncbi:MAG TPA: hypothetical protein VFX19_04105 [Dehalococcoidia bacterium]|nr:hypothetical protein [Dehalococcoidia bacterium]